MKKIGIILLAIGIIQFIVQILNLFQGKGLDNEFLITSCSFFTIGVISFFIGKYRKDKAKRESKPYKKIGWGKVVIWSFIVMIGLATLGRIALSFSENTFEGQVKKANQSCPIPIADGTGQITSIAIKDSMVVYTISYDANVITLDRLKDNPDNYKRIIILSSYLLNGQNKNGDRFMKMIIDNHYGIVFNVQSNRGERFTISVTSSEFKALLNEVEKSPEEAMKEILEWQIENNYSSLPTKLDDDMILQSILCDSANLIYRVTIEEPLTISIIKENNHSMSRKAILRELYYDPSSKANLDMCYVGNFNLIYRYVDEVNADSCDIVFSHGEISDIVRIPKSLNFR